MNVQKLVTINYSSGPKYYYIEYGKDVKYCIDHDHVSNITSDPSKVSVKVPSVDVYFSHLIWAQVVSQCHQVPPFNTIYPLGNGGWWKHEKWFAKDDFPLTNNDARGVFNFAFMGITTCNVGSSGTEYGCGLNDL